MMERRIGIWAAILFLVIASRGCSGGQVNGRLSDAPQMTPLQKLGELVVHDPEAVEEYWDEESFSHFNCSLERIKLADSCVPRKNFKSALSIVYNGVSKGGMKQAKSKVLFSSNECLVVEATQDSHEPPLTFLYQLILDGKAESPKVKQAFFLAGQKRSGILQHTNIFNQLRSTIENPEEAPLSDILTDYEPLLALQVLDGEECDAHSCFSKDYVINTYKAKFLSFFKANNKLRVTSEFEGDKHIQFEGEITSDNSDRPSHTVSMFATVVEAGYNENPSSYKVQSIHIIVQKVTEDAGETADDEMMEPFSGLQLTGKSSELDEAP